MRRLIEDTDFGLDDLQVTASFGVTEYNEDEAVDDCIKRADMALYRAKELGRNTTIVF
jgi:polar amino acid transport system substrate-binding protein